MQEFPCRNSHVGPSYHINNKTISCQGPPLMDRLKGQGQGLWLNPTTWFRQSYTQVVGPKSPPSSMRPTHRGHFYSEIHSGPQKIEKKLTISNLKMPFTKVLDQNQNFHMLKTKICSVKQFGFQKAEKEWKCPNLPCKLENVKNFASKLSSF